MRWNKDIIVFAFVLILLTGCMSLFFHPSGNSLTVFETVRCSPTEQGAKSSLNQKNLSAGLNSQEPPEADFVFSPENPKIGENVNFTDRSIEGDAEIVEWSWRFGDGDNPYDQTTSDKQNPNHTYNREAVYTVELNVTDENNLSSTTTKTVYVNPRGEVPDIVVFIVAGVLGIIVAVSFHILRREFETEEIDGDLLSDSDEEANKNYE